MNRSERDNPYGRDDDLPPLHPLLNIDDPPRPPAPLPSPPPPPDEIPAVAEPPIAHEEGEAEGAMPLALQGHDPTDADWRDMLDPPLFWQEDPQPQARPAPDPIEPALVAAAAPDAARSPSRIFRGRGRGRGRYLVAAVAIFTLILIPLTWREVGRITAGGATLQQWVRDRAVPLPDHVTDTQRLDIRPRRALRLANFFGTGEYTYELWQPDPDNDYLVAKYLLVYTGGEFKIEAAFDATTQQRMAVESK